MTYDSSNILVPWPPLLAEQRDRWNSLTTITSAKVDLEFKRGNAKPFCVKVRLEMAHGHAHTKVQANTLEAALHMATEELTRHIKGQKSP